MMIPPSSLFTSFRSSPSQERRLFFHVIIFIAIHTVDCVKAKTTWMANWKECRGKCAESSYIRNFWVTSQTNDDEKRRGGGREIELRNEMKRYLHTNYWHANAMRIIRNE